MHVHVNWSCDLAIVSVPVSQTIPSGTETNLGSYIYTEEAGPVATGPLAPPKNTEKEGLYLIFKLSEEEQDIPGADDD